MSRIYLGIVSDLKSVLKSPFWVSKLDFSTCESGNTEGPSILVTCESGNTEGPSILVTCESGNTEGPTILETYESGNTEKLSLDLYFDCVDLYILGFGLIFWVLNSYLGVWTCILGV